MNYQDILSVNSEIKTIDLKGKQYASVAERVNAFRKLYPQGWITTEIVSNDGTTVLMQAKAGYYTDDGTAVMLGTGYAQEVKGKGMVNGTSHIENCETSAVGRCLGMLGIGIEGGICSADEFDNADKARSKEEMAQMSEIRTDILCIVNGDMDALSADIKRITGGKFDSLDGMNVEQLIAIQKIERRKYAKEE